MNYNQLIRVIFRSRSIMNDFEKLNSICREIDDIKFELDKTEREIYSYEKHIPQGVCAPVALEGTRINLEDRLRKRERERDAIEDKIMSAIKCELSIAEKGRLFLENAR